MRAIDAADDEALEDESERAAGDDGGDQCDEERRQVEPPGLGDNAPCAKLSTSIKPKISVRPDAMRNSIMPMAMPAMVKVSQVEKLIVGSAAKANSGSTSDGARLPVRRRSAAAVFIDGSPG
jgi:hypothetical protein